MSRNYLELSGLMTLIKEGVAELFPDTLWVKGEIREWSPRSNGHCYLTLSESKGGRSVAEIRAMIWKWKFPAISAFFEEETGEPLRAGITVLARVQVNFSELYGMSLYIEEIDPSFTLGEKALERKRIIERLTGEGYMEMQQELALPDLPRRIAVISAATAAGLGDFRHHIEDSGYGIEVRLFEALMQGESAPESIIAALDEAGKGGFDAILILRGGGSEADLSCFDDYDLAVAIAETAVPVLTAIGHDKDVHIADMVANRSVKTPTALADLLIDLFAVQDGMIEELRERIEAGLRARATDLDLELRGVSSRIMRGLLGKYHGLASRLDGAVSRLRFSMNAMVSQAVSAVALREALIASADPRTILSRGYVLVTDSRNKIMKNVGKVSVGERIGVRFTDGALRATVNEIFTESEPKSETA